MPSLPTQIALAPRGPGTTTSGWFSRPFLVLPGRRTVRGDVNGGLGIRISPCDRSHQQLGSPRPRGVDDRSIVLPAKNYSIRWTRGQGAREGRGQWEGAGGQRVGLIPKRGKEPSTVHPRSVRRGGTIRSTHSSWMRLQSIIHGIPGEGGGQGRWRLEQTTE